MRRMASAQTREILETRKRDLFTAIHLLEQDLEDGSIDAQAYRATRRRYEDEAAAVLERLDALPPEVPDKPKRLPLLLTGGLVAVALAVFLGAALVPRGAGAITGTVPTASPRVSAVQNAQVYASSHPRDAAGWLHLGNAYLDVNQPRRADDAYRRAMRLTPTDPAPATLHAMMLASLGRKPTALSLLHRIERAHPTYARAWLLDGMLGLRDRRERPQVLAAFRRFLQLAPHSPVAPTVRVWIRALERPR